MNASFDFDAVHRRAGTDSTKWRRYGDGVLPLWVADMDFPVAPVIRAAMHRRLEHPFLGYCEPADGLKDAIRTELRERYGWSVAPEAIVFVTGVVPGFNLALKALVAPGGAIVIHTPVYPPILGAAANFGLERRDVPLERQADGTRAFDPDRLRTALAGAGALLLCHPHNPVGKVFSRAELAVIGTAALEAGAVILSDEIHCGLVFDGRGHVPMATLSPEIARRTVTLMSAGKNYNIPGLKTAFAVIEDEGLRKRFEAARAGLADVGNMLGYAATEAAYAHGRPWLDAAMAYLTRQRDWLIRRCASACRASRSMRRRRPISPGSTAPASGSARRGTTSSCARRAWRSTAGGISARAARPSCASTSAARGRRWSRRSTGWPTRSHGADAPAGDGTARAPVDRARRASQDTARNRRIRMSIERHAPQGKLYCLGVAHGGVVTTAGLVADDLTQGPKGQAEQILKKIDAVLAHFGTDKSKLLTAQLWVSDIRTRGEVNEAWTAWVDANALPVRATVEAKLAVPEMLVEIQVSAAR